MPDSTLGERGILLLTCRADTHTTSPATERDIAWTRGFGVRVLNAMPKKAGEVRPGDLKGVPVSGRADEVPRRVAKSGEKTDRQRTVATVAANSGPGAGQAVD